MQYHHWWASSSMNALRLHWVRVVITECASSSPWKLLWVCVVTILSTLRHAEISYIHHGKNFRWNPLIRIRTTSSQYPLWVCIDNKTIILHKDPEQDRGNSALTGRRHTGRSVLECASSVYPLWWCWPEVWSCYPQNFLRESEIIWGGVGGVVLTTTSSHSPLWLK